MTIALLGARGSGIHPELADNLVNDLVDISADRLSRQQLLDVGAFADDFAVQAEGRKALLFDEQV